MEWGFNHIKIHTKVKFCVVALEIAVKKLRDKMAFSG